MALPLWLCWLVGCVVPDSPSVAQPAAAQRPRPSVATPVARRPAHRAPVGHDSAEPDYSIGAAHPRARRR